MGPPLPATAAQAAGGSPETASYIPALDGLRAISIALVVVGQGLQAGGEGLAGFGVQAEREAGGVAAGLAAGAEQRVVVGAAGDGASAFVGQS